MRIIQYDGRPYILYADNEPRAICVNGESLPTQVSLTRGAVSSSVPMPRTWVKLLNMGSYGTYSSWWIKAYSPSDTVGKNNYILTMCLVWFSGSDDVYIAHHNGYVSCQNATTLSGSLSSADGYYTAFNSNNGSQTPFLKVRISEPLRTALINNGLLVQDNTPHFYVLGNTKGSGDVDIDSLDSIRPLISTGGNKPFIQQDNNHYKFNSSTAIPM